MSENEIFVSAVAQVLFVLFLVAIATGALGLMGVLLVDRVSLPLMLFLYIPVGLFFSGVFAVALFSPPKPRRPRPRRVSSR